ncbi:hypothetical protein, partial [Mitsuokella jalaludinii]|uniref:hypothetical protein n=1 Tax=Mitsuokella jalaludinii TaxID=187979 RepID=UPI00307AFD42
LFQRPRLCQGVIYAATLSVSASSDLLRADVIHKQGRLQNSCSAYALFYLDIQHILDSTGLFLEQLERQAVGQLHPFFGLALDVMDTLDSKHFPEDFGHILDNDAEMMSLSRFIVFWRGYKLHATLEPDHLDMTIFFLAARFCHAEDFLKKNLWTTQYLAPSRRCVPNKTVLPYFHLFPLRTN